MRIYRSRSQEEESVGGMFVYVCEDNEGDKKITRNKNIAMSNRHK